MESFLVLTPKMISAMHRRALTAMVEERDNIEKKKQEA
jgi:hypothetical protein